MFCPEIKIVMNALSKFHINKVIYIFLGGFAFYELLNSYLNENLRELVHFSMFLISILTENISSLRVISVSDLCSGKIYQKLINTLGWSDC